MPTAGKAVPLLQGLLPDVRLQPQVFSVRAAQAGAGAGAGAGARASQAGKAQGPHRQDLPQRGLQTVQWGGSGGCPILEPPLRSWPGGPVVFEPLLVAGRDAAGREGLWAGQMEAPGGYFSPTLPGMGWLTGLAPQSCFNEKPRGLLAPGSCASTVLTQLGALDTKVMVMGIICPAIFPGACPNPLGSLYSHT